MALITKPNTFSAGTTAVASEVNANFDTIFNDYNGNITAANLSPTLALPDTQLNQISTAGKVSGAALVSLGAIPSGGGTIPTVNLGSGSATSSTFLRGDQTWSSVVNSVTNALSGSVIQTVNTQTGAVATGTTVFPKDDTIPQNGEGDQYMSLAITPNNASNLLKITIVFIGVTSAAANNFGIGLFQDSTSAALAAWPACGAAAASPTTISVQWFMTAGTTSATTFKVRAGIESGAGTLTFNGFASGRIYGGVACSSITIEEIKA